MLREITPVSVRSRQLARDVTVARPLLAWGLGWIAAAIFYQEIPGPAGVVLAAVACACASAVTWLARPRHVRFREAERRFASLWIVLFATSPLLVLVAAPANARTLIALLISLWAVGMLLYGVGVNDRPLAGVGLLTLLTAAVTRPIDLGAVVLATGLVGGVGMTALGAWRMRWKA
jgi:hypothetical protein